MRPLHCALGLLLSLSLSFHAWGQSFPSKALRIVVPWPAGGTVDGLVRNVTPKLSQYLGQPVLVENRAGASGSVGAAEVAKASADGHTLLAVFDTHATYHHLSRRTA